MRIGLQIFLQATLLIVVTTNTTAAIPTAFEDDLQQDSKNLPILFFTGLMSSCEKIKNGLTVFHIKEALFAQGATSKLICVPYYTSVFKSMATVAQEVCQTVLENSRNWKLINGFHIIGLSQGGLFARALLEDCPIGSKVKKLVTIGTPNNGVSTIPRILTSPFWREKIDNITQKSVYSWLI